LKRDTIDFFLVEAHQIAIHERLCNWARYVAVRFTPAQHPMWRQSQSGSRQWHYPEPREEIDALDGMALERAISKLPVAHREALRWHYVWRTGPAKIRRLLGVTNGGLQKLVRDGRQMLMNRQA
jgi:DNA-directed RNA polymerase specialized sigma24 family protein